MRRVTIITATLALLTAFATAGPPPQGTPLAPAGVHVNATDEAVHVVLSVAPGETFTNTTEATFSVLDARQLRELADAVADPRILAHEAAIADLESRLGSLDADLATRASQRAQTEDQP